MKEAAARIKINKLLENAGWRFFADSIGPANIQLEPGVKLVSKALDEFGENFEKTKKGYIDFLLLDEKGFPFIVLEAKAESLSPLTGKEQARKYARSQNCRFVILSNGNLHYLWDLERGNPNIITAFPSPKSLAEARKIVPDRSKLIEDRVDDDYIALTQRPNYAAEAGWINPSERPEFIRVNKLRLLRPYQKKAIHALQRAVKEGKDRFLFEMATGTGKTLTSAAIIKLFLRSGNARRVLFLVDRLELEDQAKKAFTEQLKNDFKTVIYKENKDDWRHAEIVVTTVQSLLFNNKYQTHFSPADFDLVISDEAHRSIGGNSRAVFEYFIGYKLGLTATPKDFLKKFDTKTPTTRDPREAERRLLLDTYRTFGCENSQPTFRYSLIDGVKDGFLINPTVVDTRTDVTTQLLSDEGFQVTFTDDNGEDQEESYKQREFEKRFFSPKTNALFCKTFLENAFRDPISGEVGKSIIFAVSQNHAGKLAQILNEMADRMFPGKYHSDFAVQVTSHISDAQQFTNNFTEELHDEAFKATISKPKKTAFKLFDFFANCEYFEEDFDYDEIVKLPKPKGDGEGETGGGGGVPPPPGGIHEHLGEDIIASMVEETIGLDGMKIDRMFFTKFEETVRENEFIAAAVEAGQWDRVVDYVNREVFDKPSEFYNLEKLRHAVSIDRRLGLREILEKIFGLIPRFKSKDELLEEEFAKFLSIQKPEEAELIPALRQFFKAYITNGQVRDIIESKRFTELYTTSAFTTADLKAVPLKYRTLIPDYVKDYVSLNQFVA